MADIQTITGKKGNTYRVRYKCKSNSSGYAYKSFKKRKEAKAFLESGEAQTSHSHLNTEITTMKQAAELWLRICEKEGRNGKDPITPYTLEEYTRRVRKINEYPWPEPIQEWRTSTIVNFRTWLTGNTPSLYRAGRILSSVYGILQEMKLRDIVENNVATGVSIGTQTRYKKPVSVPTKEDICVLLDVADRLANSRHTQIAQAWQRYRPMLYLAVDSGMRPQGYVAVSKDSFFDGGIQVSRAIERPGTKISVPKTSAIPNSCFFAIFIIKYNSCFLLAFLYGLPQIIPNNPELLCFGNDPVTFPIRTDEEPIKIGITARAIH